jgi:hypothetical protein
MNQMAGGWNTVHENELRDYYTALLALSSQEQKYVRGILHTWDRGVHGNFWSEILEGRCHLEDLYKDRQEVLPVLN